MSADRENTAVWLARAGAHGEDEEVALLQGVAIIGFRDVGDLRSYSTRDDLVAALRAADPDAPPQRVNNRARQLWAFCHEMKVGDIVVLPLKSRPGRIALGRVDGPYEYRAIAGELRHTRKVKWERTDVPRSAFQQDLLYSLGAFCTVCRITRNDAERRVAAVLVGGSDTGLGAMAEASTDGQATPPAERFDIAQAAHDEIVAYVRQRFTGHSMTRLVGAILEAEGFKVTISPLGRTGAWTSWPGAVRWASTSRSSVFR